MGRKSEWEGYGEQRLDREAQLKEQLKMKRAIRETWESFPLSDRNMKYLKELNKRIRGTISCLRSTGGREY